MKRLLFSVLMGLVLLPTMGWASQDTFINSGTITFPPQIDATNVINNGVFDFRVNTTELPFDTSNTRNFTNIGTMIGSAGFRFDNAPSGSGSRVPSANFRNRLTGTITAVDGFFGTFLFVAGRPVLNQSLIPSYLLLSATNSTGEIGLLFLTPVYFFCALLTIRRLRGRPSPPGHGGGWG